MLWKLCSLPRKYNNYVKFFSVVLNSINWRNWIFVKGKIYIQNLQYFLFYNFSIVNFTCRCEQIKILFIVVSFVIISYRFSCIMHFYFQLAIPGHVLPWLTCEVLTEPALGQCAAQRGELLWSNPLLRLLTDGRHVCS